MKSRAAVAWEAAKPLVVETVDIEGPKRGEVLLQVKATGVCHTDAYTLSGKDPEGIFPCIMGHEGGAVVAEVGAGVSGLKPGDHVIPLYIPECGECKFCNPPGPIFAAPFEPPRGKGSCPMALHASQLTARPSFTIWERQHFPNIRSCRKSPWRRSIPRLRWTKFACSAAVSPRASAPY